MLGYCGINCDTCPAYQGTITTNLGLLEKAAGDFWDGAYSAKDWVCLGCTPADQGFLAKFCAKCRIRSCAIEKGVQNCAACDSFDACAILREIMESEDLTQRMTWLRERFVAGSEDP
jgi:hypothetical protein